MKKYIIIFISLIIINTLFFSITQTINAAEDKEGDVFTGYVEYIYEQYDDNPLMASFHTISLDKAYKLRVYVNPYSVSGEYAGSAKLQICFTKEESGPFFNDVMVTDGIYNTNIIETKLDAGEYELEVHISDEMDAYLNYEIIIQYTAIEEQNDVPEEQEENVDNEEEEEKEETIDKKSTIKFAFDKCSLTIPKEAKKYNNLKYYFFEDLIINSSKEIKSSDITWTTSNEKIIKINTKNNAVIPQKSGKAKITAKLPNGKKASCTVTVPEPTFKINKKSASIKAKKTLRLKITANPSSEGKNIKWKSSNKSIATVNSKGLVKGIKEGTCEITATTSTGKSYVCKLTVKKADVPKPKVEYVDILDYLNNPSGLAAKKNSSFTFKHDNGKITYACITGKEAQMAELKVGDLSISTFFLNFYGYLEKATRKLEMYREVIRFDYTRDSSAIYVDISGGMVKKIEYYADKYQSNFY